VAEITFNEMEVTNSNLPSPLLYRHVKKKKKKQTNKQISLISHGWGVLTLKPLTGNINGQNY
jgi:hypothetical protein